jgi:adenosylmethionine-8-amino-7-oxononanoate aminotransferase
VGLIGALELVPRGGRTAQDATGVLGVRAAELAREEGVIVRGIRDVVAMSPPLIVETGEIDQLFDAVARVLERMVQE